MNISKSPIVEIHGTGVHNRGAELMAIAISEKIKSIYPNAKIVVPCTFGSLSDIKNYGFYTSRTIESKRAKCLNSLFLSFISGNTINVKDVDIVLDASGFAFSDQWGHGPARKLFNKMNTSSRKNQSLILLPQALGSFKNKEVRSWVEKLFSRSTITFARDKQSLSYCSEILENKKLFRCPDFTINIKPLEKTSIHLPENFVSIVPNARMLDKLDHSQNYIEFLKKSVDFILANGMNPVFVIHDLHEDRNMVNLLGDKYSNIPIVQDNDPRVLKWILGKSQFVIGSRFHALVSSLSQGVPCIGAGWSHKYPELFEDFDNSDGLISDLADIDTLQKQISILSDENQRMLRSQKIYSASNLLKSQVNEMWVAVIDQIKLSI